MHKRRTSDRKDIRDPEIESSFVPDCAYYYDSVCKAALYWYCSNILNRVCSKLITLCFKPLPELSQPEQLNIRLHSNLCLEPSTFRIQQRWHSEFQLVLYYGIVIGLFFLKLFFTPYKMHTGHRRCFKYLSIYGFQYIKYTTIQKFG